jgi:hypothetical protein
METFRKIFEENYNMKHFHEMSCVCVSASFATRLSLFLFELR